MLLCGRYEGFDERIREILEPDEISVGDFVLNGGEVGRHGDYRRGHPAGAGRAGRRTRAAERFVFRDNRWLEFAQYTRPRSYRGLEVPPVLLSGNHEEIARWRQQDSRIRTEQRRADLLGSDAETIRRMRT